MKYETYKSLTKEEKEEWQFKFKDNKLEILTPILFAIPITWMAINATLSVVLVILKGYIEYKGQLSELISLAGKTTTSMLYITIAICIYKIGMYFYVKYQEKKWIEEVRKDD